MSPRNQVNTKTPNKPHRRKISEIHGISSEETPSPSTTSACVLSGTTRLLSADRRGPTALAGRRVGQGQFSNYEWLLWVPIDSVFADSAR